MQEKKLVKNTEMFDRIKTKEQKVSRQTHAPIDIQEARRTLKEAMKQHRPQFNKGGKK